MGTAKEYAFRWDRPVDRILVEGGLFDRVDEVCLPPYPPSNSDHAQLGLDRSWGCASCALCGWMRTGSISSGSPRARSCSSPPVPSLVGEEEDGSRMKEAMLVDVTAIFEIRRAPLPRDPGLVTRLETRGGAEGKETLEERSLAITAGPDLVNITTYAFVAQKLDVAKAWLSGLSALLLNNRVAHVCPMTCLRKQLPSPHPPRPIPPHLMPLLFPAGKCSASASMSGEKYPSKGCLDSKGPRSVQRGGSLSITRTFASGKTEKKVYQSLMELGLGAKVSSLPSSGAFCAWTDFLVFLPRRLSLSLMP